MHGGSQVAVGGEFEQFADIDHECAGPGGHVDPALRGFDLQTPLGVLQQQGDQFGVFVGADSLRIAASSAVGRSDSGVADELHQVVGSSRYSGSSAFSV